jgi:hypothetical protein
MAPTASTLPATTLGTRKIPLPIMSPTMAPAALHTPMRRGRTDGSVRTSTGCATP